MDTVERTVASSTVRGLIAYAVAHGMPRPMVLGRFGIDPAVLDDVDGRIPLTALYRLWTELPALVDDPDMPLHVLEHAEWDDPPLAMLVFMSAPTLGDGLRRLARYERLNYDLDDQPLSSVVVEGDLVHIVLDHERGAMVPPAAAVVDSLLAIVALSSRTTGAAVIPRRLCLRHPAPPEPARWVEAFGCPIEFSAERDQMTLEAAVLGRPQLGASRTLAAIVQAHAERKLAELPAGDDGLLLHLRREIRSRLVDGTPSLAELADALGRRPRTLQRQLEDAQTSVRRLVDEERHALALHHLADRKTSLTEVALLLGFSDQSAFGRAFARWTSQTPSAYRRSLAGD